MSQYHAINSAIKEGNCMGGIRVAVVDGCCSGMTANSDLTVFRSIHFW